MSGAHHYRYYQQPRHYTPHIRGYKGPGEVRDINNESAQPLPGCLMYDAPEALEARVMPGVTLGPVSRLPLQY